MINSYELWHKDNPEITSIKNNVSASKARYNYFREMLDVCHDWKYIDIRCRKLPKLQNTKSFESVALYRNVDWNCGDEMLVCGTWKAWLVDGGWGSNFEVVYAEGCPYKRGIVHVSELEKINIESEGLSDIS